MADEKVRFELVSPERILLAEDVDMVVMPGTEGDFGVLPLHAPLISTLRPGVIQVYEGDRVTRRVFVAGGFAEVNEEGATVLAEQAEPVEDIDRAEAERRVSEARQDVEDAKTDHDRERAEAALKVAEARAQAVS